MAGLGTAAVPAPLYATFAGEYFNNPANNPVPDIAPMMAPFHPDTNGTGVGPAELRTLIAEFGNRGHILALGVFDSQQRMQV